MEAKTLKAIIEEKGIKQSFIARKLKVSSQLVYQWVHGKRPIGERHLIELKSLLN